MGKISFVKEFEIHNSYPHVWMITYKYVIVSLEQLNRICPYPIATGQAYSSTTLVVGIKNEAPASPKSEPILLLQPWGC